MRRTVICVYITVAGTVGNGCTSATSANSRTRRFGTPRSSLQIDGLLEREFLGRAPHHKGVRTGDQLPSLSCRAEHREIETVNRNANRPALPGLEVQFGPADQTFGRLVGAGGEHDVDLCDLGAVAIPGVLQSEPDAHAL